MNPCCPKILTFTVSSLFHQLPGNPVPAILDGAPFVPFVTAGSEGTAGALVVFQGSSVVYARVGTGARISEFVRYGLNAEVEGVKEARSSVGVGNWFT